ncbi:MAG: HAD family hydrolase [Bacteriovorax sp.]|nr:HAD family hydrolase [Bacteriovorax sp.]
MMQVKWILFDFGGCLDSDGVHSRTLFLNQFSKYNLINSVDDYTHFQEAYTYSDRLVIDNSLIVDSTLLEMNERMCFYIAQKLNIKKAPIVSEVAMAITEIQSLYLKRNKKILEKLNGQYQLGIISNFSGNLETILKEFSLATHFSFVLDSYHVGSSKPNPAIFNLAVEKCSSISKEICFVGDNLEKDIAPAKALGMKTILISPIQLKCEADYTLSSLEELLVLTQII